MRAAFLLAFIALPLIELALLIRTGQWIGFWPTLGIVVATAIAGTALLRRQGISVLNRVSDDLQHGRAPLEPMADGAMVLVAGAFLLSPGLITDAFGLLLLIPPVRTAIRKYLVSRLLHSPNVVVDIVSGTSRGGAGNDQPRHPGGPGPVIEGDYQRLDETTRDPDRRG